MIRRAFYEFPDRRDNGGGGTGNPYPVIAWRIIAGWPYQGLDCYSFDQSAPPIEARADYGAGPIDFEERRLPLRPLWPGFAVNTLFYAAVLWLLFAGPSAVRRMIRQRRGQCAMCAYPIGTNERCTECGAALHQNRARQEAAGIAAALTKHD
jgi:predicted nucleic acid-binding Zn ribbon protein